MYIVVNGFRLIAQTDNLLTAIAACPRGAQVRLNVDYTLVYAP